MCAHVEKLSNNLLKNETEKDEPQKPVVEPINCEKIRTFIEKFDQMQVNIKLIFLHLIKKIIDGIFII